MEPAAVAGMGLKGEGDRRGGGEKPQVNKTKAVRKKMPPICKAPIFLDGFA